MTRRKGVRRGPRSPVVRTFWHKVSSMCWTNQSIHCSSHLQEKPWWCFQRIWILMICMLPSSWVFSCDSSMRLENQVDGTNLRLQDLFAQRSSCTKRFQASPQHLQQTKDRNRLQLVHFNVHCPKNISRASSEQVEIWLNPEAKKAKTESFELHAAKCSFVPWLQSMTGHVGKDGSAITSASTLPSQHKWFYWNYA